jgi:hypothetical protein
MRLWSLHPSYLDAKGLVACWREALLAQKVLVGETKGYTKHPQLIRFRGHKLVNIVKTHKYDDATAAVGAFLLGIYEEATKRGYKFDKSKIHVSEALDATNTIQVKNGQLQYEFTWLLSKLKERDPEKHAKLVKETTKEGELFTGLITHPCFSMHPDTSLEDWERITPEPEKKKSPKKSPKKATKKRSRKEVEEEEDDEMETDDDEQIVEIIETRRITRSQTIISPQKKSKSE